MDIRDRIKEKILVLDGAMGTKIQSYSLTENDFRGERFQHYEGQLKGNNDILNLTCPDIICEIHRAYLQAGADIIETNTFSSQRISQADYGLENVAEEIAYEGARLARMCADEYSTLTFPRFVAGSIGPTNRMLSMSADVNHPEQRSLTYDELCAAYRQQATAMLKGGVDLFLIETCFDTLNTKSALDACMQAMSLCEKEIPLMVSVTFSDSSGRTLSGQTVDAFLASMESYPLFSVGVNCSLGAAQLKPYVREIANKVSCYVSVHPNAGLPNALGEYDESPEDMSIALKEYIDEGLVNIVGGCCGTDEEYIRAFVALTQNVTPRKICPAPQFLRLSGMDLFEKNDTVRFVNIGERCNVAGSRKFLRLIKEKKYEEALEIARKQVENGALILDINMDDALLDGTKEITIFLNLIASEPNVAKVPIMIDSSNWDVVVSGLKCCQGKSIVNSISLKEGEEEFLKHAEDIKRFGAAVIVMCFDEEGQAVTYERKIEIAKRSYELLTQKAGIDERNIIFDPNILTIATGIEEHDNYAVDFIKSVAWIRTHYPHTHISGGVSNLSFSFRGNDYLREAMHAVFLYHAIQAGMDFGIVNPQTKVTFADIPQDELQIIEDAILNKYSGASEKLIELANKLAERKSDTISSQNENIDSWRNDSLEYRLKYALRKGIGDYIQDDLLEALPLYSKAIDIIEGPLMDGMNEVGELFGSGKMFLPQVVKTARTMRQAVDFLQPFIEADKVELAAKTGKILLATVKGDVHDIGKNIVGVVLGCNNYELIDLGIMVPAEKIVETAIQYHMEFVGLSGLITPSLTEMIHVAEEMNKAGLTIPILIGGAATNKIHVALKIQPVYQGPVVWVKDAAQIIGILNQLQNRDTYDIFCSKLREEYDSLRAAYYAKEENLSTLNDARANKLVLFE